MIYTYTKSGSPVSRHIEKQVAIFFGVSIAQAIVAIEDMTNEELDEIRKESLTHDPK